MQVLQTDESTLRFEPNSGEESELVQMLFEHLTLLRPDWPMGDRTDMAMSLFTVFKKWAHREDMTNPSGGE